MNEFIQIIGSIASMEKYIDRTIINLVTIIISGTGLFTVLTKFNVPELNMSYFDENPFAIKRDKINSVMTWIFTSLVLIGLLIQAVTLILGHDIPKRNFGVLTYLTLFFTGLLFIIVLVILLTKVGNLIARWKWQPKIIKNQKEVYGQAKFIVENDGWRENQIKQKNTLNNPEKYTQANFKKAEENLTQIEELLEIPHDKNDPRERLDRLRSYFE